jgi:iron complex transport system substrate-binding protein
MAVLLALVLGACGSKATPTPIPLPKPPQLPTPVPTATPAVIRVTDAAGQTLEFTQLPQRIVIVGRGPYMALHLLYMFPEGRQRLTGMEQKGKSTSDFLPLIDPDYGKKTVLATNPGPEAIAALKPDLVIMKNPTVDAMGTSLSKVGIPSLYVGLETPAQFFQDVTNIGAVLGNPQRAQEIIAYYQGKLDLLTKTLAGIQDAHKPRVMLVQYTDRGGKVAVEVPAKSWMQTLEMQTAGGAPVWFDASAESDGWTVVNFEQIAQWNPDKIFVVVWYTLDPVQTIAGLKVDPLWSALKAIKNNEVYLFPTDIYGWDSPEPRWLLGTLWSATRIHPDLFKDVDMTQEIYAYFDQMYGMDKAAVDASIMPKVQMNVR